ncbi:putative two-component-system connector protein AriR [Mixta intestinalis]|uniref:Putative two-component-system connector protein AriR n=2 Tax=Mixta intestinalis TaxID=1615494 RepID=A0A6P1PZH1_9GAMM|nr:putative two-component-system connector protein AriR [Mixta intestinalis]
MCRVSRIAVIALRSAAILWGFIMQQVSTTESQISQYFETSAPQFNSEKEVIAAIRNELATVKSAFSNKDIILALIEKLETEEDTLRCDIYRRALESIVQPTQEVRV